MMLMKLLKKMIYYLILIGKEQNSLSKFKNLKLIKIYLITSDKNELKNRLIKRNQNSYEEIEKRFNAFDEDIKHWNDYDYIIINKNLEVCFKQIENIIKMNKQKISISSLSTQ